MAASDGRRRRAFESHAGDLAPGVPIITYCYSKCPSARALPEGHRRSRGPSPTDWIMVWRRIVVHVIIPLQGLQGRVCVEPSDSKCKTPPIGAGLQIHWSGKSGSYDASGTVLVPDL
jgi:hypothetical protein